MSNYNKVHGGAEQKFSEYFIGAKLKDCIVHYNQLQSEQGFRFWKKNNRNCVIEIKSKEELEFDETVFMLIELGEIFKLSDTDYTLNTDFRSVLSVFVFSCLALKSPNKLKKYFKSSILNSFINSVENEDEVKSWILLNKQKCHFHSKLTSLNELEKWEISNNEVSKRKKP